MKEIKYNRNVTNTKPAVFDRELPKDWKAESWKDASPEFWKELVGVLIAVAIFMSIPWIVAAFDITFGKGVGK